MFFIFYLFFCKQQKAAFTQYTVLCAKSLILACAYVGFFPVNILQACLLESAIDA